MSHQENEQNKSYNILAEMALLMSDTHQIADVSEQKDDLAVLLRAFLVGHFADDPSTRNSILVMTDQIDAFYNLLEKYNSQEVNNALLLISKTKIDLQK